MSIPLCATGSLGGVAATGIVYAFLTVQALPAALSLLGSLALTVIALFAGARSGRAARSLATLWIPVNAALAAGAAWIGLNWSVFTFEPVTVFAAAAGLALFGLAPLAVARLRGA